VDDALRAGTRLVTMARTITKPTTNANQGSHSAIVESYKSQTRNKYNTVFAAICMNFFTVCLPSNPSLEPDLVNHGGGAQRNDEK
jgi:hypothetical protein